MVKKKKTSGKERKWEVIFAIILVSIAFILVIFYYIIFPIFKPEIDVPCTVNIIISTLLAFGAAFGIKLIDIRR